MATHNHPAPYYTFRHYLAEKYHTKVFRISVDGYQGCKGRCIFCEQHFYQISSQTIQDQIAKRVNYYKKRFKAKMFYLYLQKGTNTDASIQSLKDYYDSTLSYEQFVGFIIGTRPDCINEEVIGLIDSYTDRYDVWLEYGLQSAHDKTLEYIRRNHTYGDFLRAVEMAKGTNIKLTIHLILGLPGESESDMIESVKKISTLPIHGVKFHHLYVLDNTPLNEMVKNGLYEPLPYDVYKNLVITCIRHLRKDIVIHRVVGEDTTGKMLAPIWEINKSDVIDDIKMTMDANGFLQGDLCTFL